MNILDQFDLQPIATLKSGFWTENTFGERITLFTQENLLGQLFPDLLILSVGSDEQSALKIREHLYGLYFSNSDLKIGDIGHFTGQIEVLPSILSRLISYGILPLIIGPDQSLSYYVYLAYCDLQQKMNLISVEDYPNLDAIDNDVSEQNWLTNILTHTPNFLFNYSVLGFQGYLTNPAILNSLQAMNFDCVRLGQIRSAIESTEPYFRNADFLSVDISAIRFSDNPESRRKGPNGLHAEEACRLLRYAGMSNKMSSLHVSGWNKNAETDSNGFFVTSSLVAQMLWHFIEGYDSRIEEGPIGDDSAYTTYKLTESSVGKDLVFFKSNRSGRWWMNVPAGENKEEGKPKNMIVPCNYEDYLQAQNGEIPETWWLTFQKL